MSLSKNPPEPGPEGRATARLGPRPLALHLAIAMTTGAGALAALPGARAGVVAWSPDLTDEAATLLDELAGTEANHLMAAVARAQSRRLDEMISGIRAYHAHAYVRDLPEPDVLWQEGTTRLLDYGGEGPIAALFVPSLINRFYVLDITAERSLLRWLAGNGVRTLVVDWDAPDDAARDYDLDGYIGGRLERALDAVLATQDRPLALVGYCLGGNLALAAALRRSRDLVGLGLLAAPWDFHAGRGAQTELFQLMEGGLEVLLQGFGALPVDVLQALFASLDPNLAARKFRRFSRLEPDSRAAKIFVALEDWLNDGVPLAPKVARTCLVDWYGHNRPYHGDWQVCGAPVRPEGLELPAFVAIPANDRIVPPASTEALSKALPNVQVVAPNAGHIGMVVGSAGPTGLWQPLCDWLLGLAK